MDAFYSELGSNILCLWIDLILEVTEVRGHRGKRGQICIFFSIFKPDQSYQVLWLFFSIRLARGRGGHRGQGPDSEVTEAINLNLRDFSNLICVDEITRNTLTS